MAIKVKVNKDACKVYARNFGLGWIYGAGTAMNTGFAQGIIESKEIPLRAKIPMLVGLCGMQALATVGFGGTLYYLATHYDLDVLTWPISIVKEEDT